MTGASVSLDPAGRLRLVGVLDYRCGAALRLEGQQLIKSTSATDLVVDCSAVVKSSSVGISLLLGYMRDAAKAGKSLGIHGLPGDMAQIAEVSGVTPLFTFTD